MSDFPEETCGPLPHFELILQCMEVLESLDLKKWDTLELNQRRGWALIGRWAIERAFAALFWVRGQPVPAERSLAGLYAASGIRLVAEQEVALKRMDSRITCTEIDDGFIADDYLAAVELANGIVETIHNLVHILHHQLRHPAPDGD